MVINQKMPTGKIACWIMSLLEYNFEISHKPGILNGAADGISRIPQINKIEKGNPEVFLEEVRKEQLKDEFLIQIQENLRNPEKEVKNYVEDINGVIYRKLVTENSFEDYKTVVPESLRKDVLEMYHNSTLAGHGGIRQTYERIREHFFWPNLMREVTQHCKNCEKCSFKKDVIHVKAPLHPVKVNQPFEKVYLDLIGPLPLSEGFQYIIVFICGLTKWIEVRPLITTDAEESARAFVEEVISRHGCCKQLIMDKGSNFTSMLFTEVCKLLQIEKFHVTAYHPQGNGLCERVNGTIMKILSTVLQGDQNTWSKSLSAAVYAYRTSYHRSIGMTPFKALYGRDALFPVNPIMSQGIKMKPEVREQLNLHHRNLEIMQDKANRNNKKSQDDSKERYDKSSNLLDFRPGDLVLLRNVKLKKGQSSKLSDKSTGPWEILSQLSEVNFMIKIVDGKKSVVVHANRLKPFNPEENEQNRRIVEELFGESESESEFEGFSSASNSSSEESSNFISIVKPKISSVRLGIMLFLLGMLGIFIEARSEPNIGKIYDCSITQKLGVFSPPSETSCLKDLHARKTEIFSAEVRQYKPKITNFPIYLCEIHYVVKECSENFIGQDHTERIDTFLPVTLDQCFAAMNRRISPYGMLKKVEGENRWITQNERQYKCSWMRKRKVHYYRFVLTESSAMLSAWPT